MMLSKTQRRADHHENGQSAKDEDIAPHLRVALDTQRQRLHPGWRVVPDRPHGYSSNETEQQEKYGHRDDSPHPRFHGGSVAGH